MRRVRAETLLRLDADNLDAAVVALETSLAVARRQQAKALELRAATSLARLRADQGREDEAKSQLAAVVDWFDPELETLDLGQARHLLKSLG